jgi:hypothetical protein
MSWRKQAAHHLAFSAGQRRALGVVLALVVAYAAVRYTIHRSYISDPPPGQGERFADLADRIDPNTADWSELAALPAIGEKRARAIVARRELVRSRDPNDVAFRSAEDLFFVDGFARAVVEQARPYLEFPATQPTR